MRLATGELVSLAPQALAETNPITSATGYWYAQDGVWLDRLYATYGHIYRTQPWVAAAVDKVAALTARLPVKVWDTTPADGKKLDTTSDFAQLMANPCPLLPSFAFWRWTVSTYETYGETFWVKFRDDNGVIRAFYPMHPTRTAVTRDEDGNEWFVFAIGVASAGLLTVPADDVVPFRRWNPDGLMRGLSRLEPLRSTLYNEDSARRAMASWWRRAGRPSVILSTDRKLSKEGREKLKAAWDASQSGVDNFGGTAVLEEGLTPTVVQLDAEEMQYIESRKLNREEVCGVYDISPPTLHILDRATFSNITEQNRAIYRDTMPPRLIDLESTVDFHVRAEFGRGLVASFALDDVLRGDFETRATAVQTLVSSGVMMPSEARPLFDLPDAGEVAAQLYGNAALVPLGSNAAPAADAADDGTPAVEPVPTPPALPAGRSRRPMEYRAIMGTLGRTKGASRRETRTVLVDQHRARLGAFFAAQALTAQQTAAGGDFSSTVASPSSNDALATLLLALSLATSKTLGDAVAGPLGGRYDDAQLADWLQRNADESAMHINDTTATELVDRVRAEGVDPVEAVRQYYADGMGGRLDEIAQSRVSVIGGLAEQAAARQAGAVHKTWRVLSARPRPSHAALSGVTVRLGQRFPNGMNGPGDPVGGADEVAGCTCELDFHRG
jgi:HK97 family phage portal protein